MLPPRQDRLLSDVEAQGVDDGDGIRQSFNPRVNAAIALQSRLRWTSWASWISGIMKGGGWYVRSQVEGECCVHAPSYMLKATIYLRKERVNLSISVSIQNRATVNRVGAIRMPLLYLSCACLLYVPSSSKCSLLKQQRFKQDQIRQFF